MKKITLLMAFLASTAVFSQQKSTGVINILPGLSANLSLNDATSVATMTVNGPDDRWFAITFGNFGQPGAMSAGNDLIYYNGTTMIDATHNGQGSAPSPDTNNWTVTSNTVSSGTRTIVATRPFAAQSSDYTFNFADTHISLAGAHASSPISSSLQYHGGNRFNAGSVPFGSLGINDFSLNATHVYPNPAIGQFTIESKTFIEKVTIYTQTGALVKSVELNSDAGEININGLQSGIYLIELQNSTEKSWKKVIVN